MVLKLQPHGQEDLREVTLKREKIKISAVTSQLCSSPSRSVVDASQSGDPAAASQGKIGYIRVSTFSKTTPENAKSALQKLKADGADRQAPAQLSPLTRSCQGLCTCTGYQLLAAGLKNACAASERMAGCIDLKDSSRALGPTKR